MPKLYLQVQDQDNPRIYNSVSDAEFVFEDENGNQLWTPVGDAGTDFVNTQPIVFNGIDYVLANQTKKVIVMVTFPTTRQTAQALSALTFDHDPVAEMLTFQGGNLTITVDRSKWT